MTSVERQIFLYDRWNNIPHYTQTEKYGRGPCEPSLTSYYAHHVSLLDIRLYVCVSV